LAIDQIEAFMASPSKEVAILRSDIADAFNSGWHV
jgi:hypothetical protein